MKLFYSPTSPYVRKVMVSAMACGLEGQITKLPTNPWESPPELLAENPLSKVPCLVTEDGVALFDSAVICEYLDNVGAGALFPPPGAGRWRALKLQAIGDGLMDAAILRRQEQGRPAEAARQAAIERYQAAVTRALDALEQDPPPDHLDIGTITIACALGYLDFRFSHEDWRPNRPHLAKWFEGMAQRAEIAATAPS
jgi:glutathione S-transferase